jgi:hypothetical protein
MQTTKLIIDNLQSDPRRKTIGYDTRKFVATDIDEKKIKKERELELIYAWYTMFTAGGGLDMRLSNLEEFCVKTVTNVLRHCA